MLLQSRIRIRGALRAAFSPESGDVLRHEIAQVAKNAPHSPEKLWLTGECHLLLGALGEALKDFRAALRQGHAPTADVPPLPCALNLAVDAERWSLLARSVLVRMAIAAYSEILDRFGPQERALWWGDASRTAASQQTLKRWFAFRRYRANLRKIAGDLRSVCVRRLFRRSAPLINLRPAVIVSADSATTWKSSTCVTKSSCTAS